MKKCWICWTYARELGPNFHLMLCFLILMIVCSFLLLTLIAEWDDDMTYLYVDYPYYKKYMIFVTMSSVIFNIFFNVNFSYFSFTTITSSSTIRTCNSLLRWLSAFSSSHPTCSTSNIESKSLDAIFSTSMFKWELMSLLRKENLYWKAKRWRNGFGLQLISRRPSLDATDNHSRTMHQISQIQNCSCKTLWEDTQMILLRNHWQSPIQELESEIKMLYLGFTLSLI